MNYIEIIGYFGSVLVAISLMMSKLKLLRWINLIGASIFALYGFLVGAYPVFVLNSFIAVADIFHLYKLSSRYESFSYIQIKDKTDSYLQKFLEYYGNDIRKYYPGFEIESLKNISCFFTLRNMVPAGLFIYEGKNYGTVEVIIDYVIPPYRDLKNSRYIYSDMSAILKKQGYEFFTAKGSADKHNSYLRKIGFEKISEEENNYLRKI